MTCDHYAVRLKGQLTCRDCHAACIIDINGQHWRPPLTPSERGQMGGRPRL